MSLFIWNHRPSRLAFTYAYLWLVVGLLFSHCYFSPPPYHRVFKSMVPIDFAKLFSMTVSQFSMTVFHLIWRKRSGNTFWPNAKILNVTKIGIHLIKSGPMSTRGIRMENNLTNLLVVTALAWGRYGPFYSVLGAALSCSRR